LQRRLAEARVFGDLALHARGLAVQRVAQRLAYRRAELAKAINEFINGGTDQAGSIDIDGLLAAGEGNLVEFRSSTRWDFREQKVNKPLEQVIVKTVASFLKHAGALYSSAWAMMGISVVWKPTMPHLVSGQTAMATSSISYNSFPAASERMFVQTFPFRSF